MTIPQARTPHEQTALQRQIAAKGRQIDALVCELYELTEEKIGIVVERGKRAGHAVWLRQNADPGSSKKPRGDDAKTRRSRDGTWAKKGDETHFGYKLHL